MLGVSWKWVAAGGLVLLGLWKGVLGSVILILYGSYTATARDTAIRRDSPDWVLRRRWAQANGLPESAVRLIGGLLVVLGAINLVSVAFMPMWVFAGLQMIAIAVIGASLVLKGLSGGTNENVVGVQQNYYPWLPLVAAAAVFAVVYTQTRPVVANDSPVHTMEDLKKAKGMSSKR